MRINREHTIQAIAHLLIVVFFLMLVGKALYTHTHTLFNGYTIVHAHPDSILSTATKNDTSKESHSHTKNQLNVLDMFTGPLAILLFTLFLIMLFAKESTPQQPLQQALCSVEYISSTRGRAPPFTF